MGFGCGGFLFVFFLFFWGFFFFFSFGNVTGKKGSELPSRKGLCGLHSPHRNALDIVLPEILKAVQAYLKASAEVL